MKIIGDYNRHDLQRHIDRIDEIKKHLDAKHGQLLDEAFEHFMSEVIFYLGRIERAIAQGRTDEVEGLLQWYKGKLDGILSLKEKPKMFFHGDSGNLF